MQVTKIINFNGQQIRTTGTVVRTATPEDKANVVVTGDYYIIDFTYNGVQYRGLWDVSECLVEKS